MTHSWRVLSHSGRRGVGGDDTIGTIFGLLSKEKTLLTWRNGKNRPRRFISTLLGGRGGYTHNQHGLWLRHLGMGGGLGPN